MDMLITSKIKSSGLHCYYDLISRGMEIIVSAQIDLSAPLHFASGEFASGLIMTFGQSHTNKQPRQTITSNYNYCSSAFEFISTRERSAPSSGSFQSPNIKASHLLTLTANKVFLVTNLDSFQCES